MEQMITNFFTQFMHKNNSQLAAGPTKPQSKQSGALWIVALKCRNNNKKYNNNRKKATWLCAREREREGGGGATQS